MDTIRDASEATDRLARSLNNIMADVLGSDSPDREGILHAVELLSEAREAIWSTVTNLRHLADAMEDRA